MTGATHPDQQPNLRKLYGHWWNVLPDWASLAEMRVLIAMRFPDGWKISGGGERWGGSFPTFDAVAKAYAFPRPETPATPDLTDTADLAVGRFGGSRTGRPATPDLTYVGNL